MSDIVLSLLVLGVLAMGAGGVFVWKRGDRRRAILMFIAGVVMAANVAIWTIPAPDDAAPSPSEAP